MQRELFIGGLSPLAGIPQPEVIRPELNPHYKQSLPWRLLFQSALGIHPDAAITAVPFWQSDPTLTHIPGKILRVNDLNVGPKFSTLAPQEIEQKVLRYEHRYPLWGRISTVAADLSLGFPELPYKPDLVIVNHGIILPKLRGKEKGYRRYLESMQSAVRPGKLLMVIGNGDVSIMEIKGLTQSEEIEIPLPPNIVTSLGAVGLRPRLQRGQGSPQVGDYISISESDDFGGPHPIVFLKRV